MNWGDSPAVTNVLHKEYSASIQELGKQDLELGDYDIGPHESLMQLKDRGFTPRMIASSKLTWKQAVRRFGMNALIEFGMEFAQAAEMGFDASDFDCMSTEQLIRMKSRPYDLLASGLHASDLVRMHATLHDTIALGLSTPLLRKIGFTEDNVSEIGIDLQTWRRRDPFYREAPSSIDTEYTHVPQTLTEVDETSPKSTNKPPAIALRISTLPQGSLQF